MESRRSNANISYLTLSPITTRIPLDDDGEDGPEVPTPWKQRTSYLSGKSAPSTPKILSRSPSRTRLDRISSTKLAGSKSYTSLSLKDSAQLSRSKSTTHMLLAQQNQSMHRRKKSSKSSSRLSRTETDNGEWLFRAGAAISSETRESKGQGWLVSRDSSTSLIAQRNDDDDTTDDNDTRHRGLNGASTRTPRAHSRAHSRATSAKTSRRGSRVGSRPDLSYFATPADGRTPMAGRSAAGQDMGDYFGRIHDPTILTGPDFVDEVDFDDNDYDDDESDEDAIEEERREEDEIRKLASDRGFGLGSVVDRFLGWTLFDTDGQETDDETTTLSVQSSAKQTQNPTKVKIETLKHKKAVTGEADSKSEEESQGWNDAAWLLSVASKVLL